MPEHHFRFSNYDNRENLGRIWRRKTQERGYLATRAQECSSGVNWACSVHCSTRESVMASNQESNNVDDFDIEEVINWEEHNYASKNLDQHLGDIDLSSDLPTSTPALQASHSSQPQASRGRTVIISNQVIGSRQQQPQEQAAPLPRQLTQTSSSVLNPVFPQDASYMLSDIRQELSHPRVLQDNHHEVQPSFPSENFDLPSIQHGRRRPTSGSQVLNFISGHNQHMAVSGSQLGHTIGHHPTLHNGMQSFSQTGLHSNIANVDESMNHGLDHEQGEDNSIDQLIEDIVDRDLPQGVGDTVEFSSHDVSLVSQPQQMHHVMAQAKPIVTTSSLTRNASSMHGNTGSPSPSSGQITGGNIPHAHSPLSQNPASPAIPKSASSQQYKTSQMRGNRGNITGQQQPHSPQSINMGMVPSPRSAPQRSPQNHPQQSPQTPSAQSPPSNVMSQNMPSPISTGAMNMNSPVIGSMGMPHSPVPSPLNISSPQGQRLSRQTSPGGCNIGSPVSPAMQQTFQKSQGLPQNYMAQVNQAKAQSASGARSQVNVPNSGSAAMHAAVTGSGQNPAWPQSQFIQNQQRPIVSPSQGSIPSPGQQRQAKGSQGGVPSPGQPRQVIQGSVPSPGQPRQTMQGSVPSPGQPRQTVQGSVPSPGQPRQTIQGSIPSPGQQLPRQPTPGNVQSAGQQQHPTSSLPQGQLQRQALPGNPAIPGNPALPVQANMPLQGQPQGSIQHPRQLQRQNSQGNAASTLQQRQPAQAAMQLQQQPKSTVAGQQQQNTKPATTKAQQTVNVNIQANPSVAQQGNPGVAGQQMSPLDAAAVLRGLTALQGNNVVPFQLKQGGNQQLQAIKIPQNSANLDILKQAAQATGKPMAINTSQGQVLCYILPKNAVNTQAGVVNTQGQQVKMVVLNTKASSGSSVLTTVNSTGVTANTVGLLNSAGQKPAAATVSKTAVTPQQHVAAAAAGKQTPNQVAIQAATKPVSSVNTNILTPITVNQRLIQAPANVNVVSNPSTAQTVNTTKITFVNESTSVDHFVSVPPESEPLTTTVSSVESKMTPTLLGDSDDSDTPLAVLAKHMKKANGEEKKKKKKKKGEKRKKKEKGGIEKPLPAFQIFFKETQAAIRQQNPSIDFENVTKIITQMWDNLPEDQKQVYHTKHEKAKKDFEKELLEKQKMEPSPKLRKLDTTTPSPISSPKTTTPTVPTLQPITIEATPKEPVKESITLKIPKAVLNKADVTSKAKTSIASKVAANTTFAPTKTKKPRVSINPISQRVCIRDGCNMPARTTKERGTQYCSNECIVAHCRNVFQSWVTKRKESETVQVA